jgi:hypothetical protein
VPSGPVGADFSEAISYQFNPVEALLRVDLERLEQPGVEPAELVDLLGLDELDARRQLVRDDERRLPEAEELPCSCISRLSGLFSTVLSGNSCERSLKTRSVRTHESLKKSKPWPGSR